LTKIDQVSYEKAPTGQSYNRTPSENDSLTGQAETGWTWSENLTPGAHNIIPEVTKGEEESTAKVSEEGLASVGQKLPRLPHALLIFLIALAIAIFSGVIILFLRKKIKAEQPFFP